MVSKRYGKEKENMIGVMGRLCLEDPALIAGWIDHLLLFSHEKSVPASPLQTFSFQIE